MNKFYTIAALIASMCTMAHADIRTALAEMQNAMLYTDYFYVDTVNADQLAENAIRGMLKELDPHSTYLTKDEVKQMNEGLGGNFEGIGVRYQMERDTLVVINTVIGGPSEKVGVMAGDRIVAVNDSSIAGQKMPNKEIQRRLRGPKGTLVKVTVLRDNERIDFSITRDVIPVYSVDASYMAAPGIGYIKISRFAQTTPNEVETAMNNLAEQGMRHLIIDLQGNGGGYLESAVQLASLFLDRGEIIVYTEGRRESRKNHLSNRMLPFNGRLVVLTDEESASSSEIFSGAIQDWDRGVIVGRRTFGKGLVQRPIELPSGAMIRLTIAHYFTPSGRCIQKPYKKGDGDDYRKDLITRFKNGEYTSADSIHLPDSLKFQTNGKRTVYGGGGIMPDVFVPMDTTKMTKTHRNIIARGTLNRWVLAYFRDHQREMHAKYPKFEKFDSDFVVTDAMLQSLLDDSRADSIAIDSAEIEKSASLLKMHMKAHLASDLYEGGAFNRIMNRRIAAYKEAISLIGDEKRYEDILRPKNAQTSNK
ncbi:MAG: S41 family peptidase [Bacteroidales bacterium]|nr:S41 family peptidase [Bacteroidales bacterium]